MRKASLAATAALGLALAACTPVADDDGLGQLRSQVERQLFHLGVSVPGGVGTLSDDQVVALALQLDLDRRDDWMSRIQRAKGIIAGGG